MHCVRGSIHVWTMIKKKQKCYRWPIKKGCRIAQMHKKKPTRSWWFRCLEYGLLHNMQIRFVCFVGYICFASDQMINDPCRWAVEFMTNSLTQCVCVCEAKQMARTKCRPAKLSVRRQPTGYKSLNVRWKHLDISEPCGWSKWTTFFKWFLSCGFNLFVYVGWTVKS